MSDKSKGTQRKQQAKEFSSSWQNFRKLEGDKSRSWTRRDADDKTTAASAAAYGASPNANPNPSACEGEQDDRNSMKHFRNRSRLGRKRFGFGYGFNKHDSSGDHKSWHARSLQQNRQQQGTSQDKHAVAGTAETGEWTGFSAHTSTFQASKSDDLVAANPQSESQSEHIAIALPAHTKQVTDKYNKNSLSDQNVPLGQEVVQHKNTNNADGYTYPYHYEYPKAAFRNWRTQSRGTSKQLFENYHRGSKWKKRRGSQSRSRSFGWSDHRSRRSRSSRWSSRRYVFQQAPQQRKSFEHHHHRPSKSPNDPENPNPIPAEATSNETAPERKRRQRSQRSYGIILYKNDSANPSQRQYLAIRRKNNIGFEEITRGKYDPMNVRFLLVLANDMTHAERSRLLDATDFRPLWYSVWHDLLKQEDTDSDEYKRAENNFWQLKRGFYVEANSETARFLSLSAAELLQEHEANRNNRCTCVSDQTISPPKPFSPECSVCGRDRKSSTESATTSSGESAEKRRDPSFSDSQSCSQSYSQSYSWASGDDDDDETSTVSYKESDNYDEEPDAVPETGKPSEFNAPSASSDQTDNKSGQVFVSWQTIFERVVTNYNHPNVEFPKGRKDRSRNESSIECAQREMCEETTVDASRYQMKHLQPVHETFTGLNNVRYRYTYYVAELKSDASDSVRIDDASVTQLNEVSDVQWYTFDQLLQALRPTDSARKKALIKVHCTLGALRRPVTPSQSCLRVMP